MGLESMVGREVDRLPGGDAWRDSRSVKAGARLDIVTKRLGEIVAPESRDALGTLW